MMKANCLLLALAFQVQADPRVDRWIRSSLPAGARAVGPEVHEVRADEQFVTVESAGLSMQSLGVLESRPFDGASGVRRFTYRIPREPRAAARPVPIPLGVVGAFINGVPIYNPGGVFSYRDQNLWHADPVARHPSRCLPSFRPCSSANRKHSPLIGFALDGFPIHGPFGWSQDGVVQRLRSSYRVRSPHTRRRLPGGPELTPAQEGPEIAAEFPGGAFVEDYEFVSGSGDLDEHNGRFAKTPDFPEGTYAYFLSTRPDGTLAYPYLIGPTYKGELTGAVVGDWEPLSSAEGLQLSSQVSPWRAGEPAAFAITSPYPVLERVHEKELHVLVISDDLSDFSHIHPDPITRQFYAGSHVFPRAGFYWIFVDHTSAGQGQTIARFRVKIDGPPSAAVPLPQTAALESTGGGIRATLTTAGSVRAEEDIAFRFSLTDEATGDLIPDLEPYLGAWGHILFVRQEGDEVIHAHPIEENTAPPADPWVHAHAVPGPSPEAIETITGFRRPGLYKVWLQVQRRQTVLAFPFILPVSAPAPVPSSLNPPARVPNAQVISVTAKGYAPARILTKAKKPIRLVFQRLDAQNCGSRVVFPQLGIHRELPPGKEVLVEIPPQAAQELTFSCGMGMYRGSLVVR